MWLGRGSWAVLDQALFAGSNFTVNILMARWLPQEQYGAFVVTYSAFLLLGAFHTAALTQPMLVFGAGRYRETFSHYLALLLYGHVGIATTVSLIMCVPAAIAWAIASPELGQAFAGLAVASPFILAVWLLRRAFYVPAQPDRAATGGALYLVLTLGGIYGVQRADALSPFTAFVVMGVASLPVGIWFIYLLRPQWRRAGSTLTREAVLIDHWGYTKWSGPTVAMVWIPENSYYVLLPAWAGLDGSAALRAAMNFALPALHLHAALGVLLVPLFVRTLQRVNGWETLSHLVKSLLVLFMVTSACYWSILAVFGGYLLDHLYGGRYSECTSLLGIVGLLPLATGSVCVLGGVLRAAERPDYIFWCYVASGLTTLTLGLLLAGTNGIAGSVIGILVSSATLAGGMGWGYSKCTKEARRVSAEASAGRADGLRMTIA